ncbi:MAG: ABC transporter ATP-binding protein [SAR324 cluster bacterium]|nr:ABC transporter ATP-binding protein [SAR324 cluster bacterium]
MSIEVHAASVRFENVTKAYGDVIALNHISFEIESGQLVTLLGPSGCGKTTNLRLIAGLEFASSGKIFIGDQDVTLLPATDRNVSMVFQSYALFPHMTVMENVSYGLTIINKNKQEVRELAEAGLMQVGLEGYGKRLPSELSGGQQQRVAVARALVLKPAVLLFDEPLSNLDAKLRRTVREEIRELQQSLGLTVAYVTHDQEEALAVSDRIIVMKNAAIAQEGSPRELYIEPDNLFVADFIGDTNLLKGALTHVDEKWGLVKIDRIEKKIRHRGLPVGETNISVRPNAVQLSTENNPNTIEGTIAFVAYLGDHMEYTVNTAIGPLFVIDYRVDTPFANGTKVFAGFIDRGISLVK